MPELDAFLNATAQEQVDLFDSRVVQSIEGGIKTAGRRRCVHGERLLHQAQEHRRAGPRGRERGHSPGSSGPRLTNRSYGAEVEGVVIPLPGLQFQGNVTVLKAELGGGIDSLAHSSGGGWQVVPTHLGNLAALYSPAGARGLQLKADWHWVGSRFSEDPLTRPADNPAILPFYNYFNFGVGFDLPAPARGSTSIC